MKVLLIKPYNLTDHIQPSLGLGYLATAIRQNHTVKILDCIKDNVTISKLPLKIKEFQPNVVGFQCYTFDLAYIKRSLKIIKKINYQITTIIGGPHPSSVPEETMHYFGSDLNYAFVGEAEIGLPKLLDRLAGRKETALEEIPGLVWSKENRIRINQPILMDDLDKLGLPAWDLINPQTYPEAQHGAFFENFPIAPIITTRGCPFHCTFCAAHLIAGRKLRKRSVNHILNEIKLLYANYGIREFHVVDDNFSWDRKFVKEFLERLIELNIKISWAVPNGVRMDTFDTEILELMKKSGLYLISVGIESGTDRILKMIKKGITTKKIKKYLQMIKSSGIALAGFFIMGLPTEKRHEIEKTIKFSLELPLIRANFFTYLPFPGTESYNSLHSRGELTKVDWESFYFMSAAYTPEGINRNELKYLQRKAFIKFYLRPKILYYNLTAIKSFRHLGFLLKRFYHWIVMK